MVLYAPAIFLPKCGCLLVTDTRRQVCKQKVFLRLLWPLELAEECTAVSAKPLFLRDRSLFRAASATIGHCPYGPRSYAYMMYE